MPPKQIEPQRFILMVNDEVIREFNAGGMVDIKDINIFGSNYDESIESADITCGRTFDIPFMMKGKERKKLAHHLRTSVYGKNNWRRLHGLPAIRRFRR